MKLGDFPMILDYLNMTDFYRSKANMPWACLITVDHPDRISRMKNITCFKSKRLAVGVSE